MAVFYIGQRDCDLTQWTIGDPVKGEGQIDEAEGSPTITWERTGFAAVRKLIVSWDIRYDVAREILGGGDIDGDSYVFHRPHKFPDYEKAIATTVKIAPFVSDVSSTGEGQNDILATYTAALLTVEYSTPTFESAGSSGDESGYDPSNPIFVTESFESAAEFLNLPTDDLYWSSAAQTADKVSVQDAPGKLLRMLTWNVTFHHVLSYPDEILDWPGTVNQYTHYSPSIGTNKVFAPHTLLCGSPIIRREFSAYGRGAYELELSWTWRCTDGATWNQFLAKDGQWQPLYKGDGSTFTMYQEADYRSILPVP